METNLLPASIEMRALKFMEQGNDPIESVRLAIEEENNTIWMALGVDMKTGNTCKGIAKEIKDELCTRVYNRLTNPQNT